MSLQSFPDFITALGTAGSADFFHRHSTSAPWEPYPPDQCRDIFLAIRSSPSGGRLPLGTSPFELRWGTEARSGKMPSSDTGMMQVNRTTENTRLVKGEPVQASATAYAHLEPRTDQWVPYTTEQNDRIGAAIRASPAGGRVKIAHDLPFEVRWGNDARGGMIQMNVNTRFVRKVKEVARGDVEAPPPVVPPPVAGGIAADGGAAGGLVMGVPLSADAASLYPSLDSVPVGVLPGVTAGNASPATTPAPPVTAGATVPVVPGTLQQAPAAPPSAPAAPPAGTVMSLVVPPGMAGGQTVQVPAPAPVAPHGRRPRPDCCSASQAQTPKGLMQIDIPYGLVAGQQFQFLLPP